MQRQGPDAVDRPLDLRDALERVDEIARTVARRNAEAVDRDAAWPEEALRALQGAGLGGLVVPTEHGGLGHGLYAIAQACESLGRECASTALCFGMHCVGSAVIAAKATEDQVERYLGPIVRGEHLTTLALSEPGTGAHFYFPRTELGDDGQGGYRVNGGKSFVTNGSHIESYVISTVAARAGAPAGQFSCLVLRGDLDGVEWGPHWAGLGMRGNDSRSVTLTDVPVPREDLLGSEGDELWYVFEVIAPYFLMAMAGSYLGVAQAALEAAIEHVRERGYSHSGTGLASQPVIQHRLGSMWSEVERTRRLIRSAANRADAGDPDALPAILAAKAETGDCAVSVANEAMTVCGGIAYRDGSRLDRCLRDARASHVMSPTTDLLRTWTGRALLGQPLLAE